MMTPDELDKLVARYLQDECTDEEKALIDSFYARLGTSGEKPTEILTDEDALSTIEARLLKKLQHHTGAPVHTRRNTVRKMWAPLSIAASILMLIVAGYFIRHAADDANQPNAVNLADAKPVSFENSGPTTKRIILPDGSLIKLYPGARVKYISQPASLSRELHLEGQAYFDVSHDAQKPFYVYAGNVVAKVLGTSFNINAGEESIITVTVKTGQVSVYSKNDVRKGVVLSPNQEAVYNRKTNHMDTYAISSTPGTDAASLNKMRFDETAVAVVLETLSKTYEVPIAFDSDNLTGCVLTSTFEEEGFYDRIEIICTAIGATYTIVDAKVVITSTGCNKN